MEWWQAIILGLVEGITEYLPVSSTGHLIITTELMGFEDALEQHVKAFNIVVQGGAILAVAGLYWQRVKAMALATFRAMGKPAALRSSYANDAAFRLAVLIVVAFLPAAVLGVLLNELIDAHLFSTWPVLAALALGGVWMIWLDRWRNRQIGEENRRGVGDEQSRFRHELEDLTMRQALAIGLMQCVAMWPGTSRSMMTIAGGTLMGLKPRAAAEFSFLLGLPTLGGACVYKLFKNVTESDVNLFDALGWGPVLIGVAVATASAALAVKWLVAFLNKHGLAPFGWYRLALTAVLGSLIAAGAVVIS